MTTLDIINKTLEGRPEGRSLLNIIVVKLDDVKDHIHKCMFLQSIVKLKFDIETLKTTGYSLQQILDLSEGVIENEAQKFVLNKLQSHIASNN